jgi:putative hydroxymethylpyrimidine transporter CytX
MKKGAMTLLWMGASISLSEVITGGLLVPLGLFWGSIVILVGHVIGTGLLGLGGYVSFFRKQNGMNTVSVSLGETGGKMVAFCNLFQLFGWIVILLVQSGNAITSVFSAMPFWAVTLVLAFFQLVWALLFNSPAGKINNVAVLLLASLCIALFIEAVGDLSSFAPPGHGMGIALGIELSLFMPVSWLPLIGDYSSTASDKWCASAMPFIGYFAGSCLMYFIGLFIGVSSGNDIFHFIAGSRFRYIACVVVLLSTATTNFVALYSAAISSGKLTGIKQQRLLITVIGITVAIIAAFFPVERFEYVLEKFLTVIGMVFIPVYTVVFLDFFLKKEQWKTSINWGSIITALLGMASYWIFNTHEIGIPSLLSIAVVAVVYVLKEYIATKTVSTAPRP